MDNLDELLEGMHAKTGNDGIPLVEAKYVRKSALKKAGVHVKMSGPSVLDGIDYLTGEYMNLRKIYGAAPVYVSMPYAMIVDRDGDRIGYISEEVPGQDLSIYRKTPHPESEKKQIIQEIKDGTNAMRANGVGHGDIDGSNVRVYRDSSGNPHIKFIDPSPSFCVRHDAENVAIDEADVRDFIASYSLDAEL